MMAINKRILSVLVCLLLLLTLPLAASAEITSKAQLNNESITVGVGQGTTAELAVKEELPNANMQHYVDYYAAYELVAQGKLDAFIFDRRQMQLAIDNGLKGVRLLDENMQYLTHIAVGISVVSKIPDLENKVNTFIEELRADGTLDDMYSRWVDQADDTMPEIRLPEKPQLHLTVGTSGIVPPYSYYKGNELHGYDIELARRFAAWLGADLSFKVYDYSAIFTAAASGDIDVIMANLQVSEERRESLPYSVTLYDETMGIMVRDESASSAAAAYASPQDLAGKKIGAITGGHFIPEIKAIIPDADIQLFNHSPDALQALRSKKVDAMVEDEPIVRALLAGSDDLTTFPLNDDVQDFAFPIPKTAEGEALNAELSEFIRRKREDGTLAEFEKIWMGADDSLKKPLGYASLPATNGTLRVAVESVCPPFDFVMDNEIVGYEMAILDAFCREKGYALEVEDLEFSAIMAALQAGKFDLGSASFTVTPERMESCLFTEPTYQGSVAVIVRKTGEAARPSFWESLSASFDKTFIRENRWRLFADGIRNTLLITLLSVFFGTLLGFIMYLPCRKANPIANTITRIAVWLVEGLPMVVLLMVLYYLVFASVAISGIAVAVIGFTLTFGSAVFGMLKMGVGAVDRGQMEAASALGFGDWHAFFGLILPQAMPHMLPSYKGAIAALIKETSIVGYIAVQDLTKMGDIVRSRTYDAFFPLIAVSLIYFILAAIINWIIGRLLNRTNPKRKNRAGLLKGVNVHD